MMDLPENVRLPGASKPPEAEAAEAAPVSGLRLFLHCQRGGADGELARWRMATGLVPEWIKVLARIHCSEAKAAAPGIKTILRDQALSEDDRYLISEEAGRQFVRDASMRWGGFQDVDALEFMNEKTSFDDALRVQASNTAAIGFIQECARFGVKPIVHNAAFANPRPDLIRYLAPSIQLAIQTGGYFGLHCYGPKNLFDASAYYVECYLGQLAELARVGVNVPADRVLITEFGHDVVTDPNYTGPSGPWRALGISPEYVQGEYQEYNRRLIERGIGGAFIYDWFSYGSQYEHAPEFTNWYQGQLSSHPAPAPQPVTYKLNDVVYVNTDPGVRLIVRESASAAANWRAKLHRGYQAIVLQWVPGWVNVIYYGKDSRGQAQAASEGYGWLSTDYITKTPIAAPEAPQANGPESGLPEFPTVETGLPGFRYEAPQVPGFVQDVG